jgi:hypothetical protein
MDKKHDRYGALRLDERHGSHVARYDMGEGLAHRGMGVDAMARHESSSAASRDSFFVIPMGAWCLTRVS